MYKYYNFPSKLGPNDNLHIIHECVLYTRVYGKLFVLGLILTRCKTLLCISWGPGCPHGRDNLGASFGVLYIWRISWHYQWLQCFDTVGWAAGRESSL